MCSPGKSRASEVAALKSWLREMSTGTYAAGSAKAPSSSLLLAGGRRDRRPGQPHLAGLDLAVVLADRADSGAVAGVRAVAAQGPLPNILVERRAAAERCWMNPHRARSHRRAVSPPRRLVLELGRQALARPMRVGRGLVIADVADRLGEVPRPRAAAPAGPPTPPP